MPSLPQAGRVWLDTIVVVTATDMIRLFAACALLAAAAAQDNEACSATTAIDGRDFPNWVRVGGATQALTGGGTRYKYRLAKVYALALYVDEAAVAGPLAGFAGRGADALAADPKFFTAVAGGAFAKTLLLNFHLRVHGDAIAKALRDALGKRLAAAPLAAFQAAVERALVAGTKAGTQLYFFCGAEHLGVAVDSTAVAETVAGGAAICAALMDTYYGADPVSHQAKDGMARGAARLLA